MIYIRKLVYGKNDKMIEEIDIMSKGCENNLLQNWNKNFLDVRINR